MLPAGLTVPGARFVRGSPGDRRAEIELEGVKYLVQVLSLGGDANYGAERVRKRVCQLARDALAGLPQVRFLQVGGAHAAVVVDAPRGASLAEYIGRGALTDEMALGATRDVYVALESLHSTGDFHGDVSLESIVADESGSWRFLDYGPGLHPVNDAGRIEALASHQAADYAALASVLEACLLRHQESGAVDSRRLESIKPAMAALVLELRGRGSEERGVGQHQFLERLDALMPSMNGAASTGVEAVAGGVVRQSELAKLRRVYSSDQRDGLATVVIRGGAGSGKSHLVRAFTEVAAARAVWAVCRNWEVAPLGAVRQLIEALVSNDGSLCPRRVKAISETVGELTRFARPLSPLLTEAFPEGGNVPDSEGADDVYSEGLAELLGRVFGKEPSVIVLEDVHWLDEASRKVLKRVFERLTAQTLLIATTRNDPDSERQAQRFLIAAEKTLLWDYTLAPLEPLQAASVAAHYLGSLVVVPEHASALAVLSDGSPLSVIEVVRSVLDAGLLLPNWDRWSLDVPAVALLRLPSRTTDLMAQRLSALEPEKISLLRVAAIIGQEFDAATLRVAVERTDADVADAVGEARRLYLVERSEGERFRFVHQCVRDALTAPLSTEDVQRIHGSVVEALRRIQPGSLDSLPAEVVFQLANHASLQGSFGDRAFACQANIEAGKRAIAAYDNARSLSFLEFADVIASEEQRRSSHLRLDIAEARLRLGLLRSSSEMFESELVHLQQPMDRARVRSRLSCICEANYDSAGAVAHLEKALDELGEPVPKLTLSRLPGVVRLLFRSVRVPETSVLSDATRRRSELLCSLYSQLNRLAILKGQIGRLLDATARCLDVASSLGESPAMARAHTWRAFLLTLFKRKGLAQKAIDAGLRIARRSRDSSVIAHILTHQAGVAAWRGQIDSALELGAEAMTQFQAWMIPSELALMAMNQEMIETVRGRARRAWPWLRSVIVRAEQYEGAPILPEVFALRARALAVRMGTEHELAETLARLDSVCLEMPQQGGYHAWIPGPTARTLVEGNSDPQLLERLVTAVEAEGLNPRRVHLAFSEYYVVIAHARVNACLKDIDKPALRALDKAAADLNAAARIPLLQAHARVIAAFGSLFRRRMARASAQFDEAERMAIDEKAPWVSFAVARGRAHMLRLQGRPMAALEQARAALATARENGVVAWERWIVSEFDIASPNASHLAWAPPGHDRTQRHLRAFLNVSRASSVEVDPQKQAQLVLDEMIEVLSAERGALYLNGALSARGGLSPTTAQLRLLAARQGGRIDDPDPHSRDTSRVEGVLRSAEMTVSEHVDVGGRRMRTTVLPLSVQDQVVGAVCLEGPALGGTFSEQDTEVLRALAKQVPIALELAHVLRDRERLEEDLRQSQKMEAIGRLAGGIAHDFNNMLAAICVASEAVLSECSPESTHRADLETIQRAADRATRLTRQLLAFSRRQVFDARPLDLNETVRGIVPMLKRLLGHTINIEAHLNADLYAVKADATQLEQVLVNLAVNARDAMPDGGCLRLMTRNTSVAAGTRSVLEAGEYVVLVVSDDGVGMVESVQRRIFEPFFTTKTSEAGTGLGMAMVYGIVRQSGGHIELDSEVGIGTEFRIFLPRTLEAVRTLPPPSSARGRASTGSVLLVDDEPLVRHAFGRTLRRMGYDVTVATGGREAIRILKQKPNVDLIITDVIMPEMNGVELIEQLSAMGIRARVLYMSGYADGVLTRRSALGEGVAFMQKPIQNDELAAKVEQMLSARVRGSR